MCFVEVHWYTLRTLETCEHSTSYLPTFSHLLIVNKLLSLSVSPKYALVIPGCAMPRLWRRRETVCVCFFVLCNRHWFNRGRRTVTAALWRTPTWPRKGLGTVTFKINTRTVFVTPAVLPHFHANHIGMSGRLTGTKNRLGNSNLWGDQRRACWSS